MKILRIAREIEGGGAALSQTRAATEPPGDARLGRGPVSVGERDAETGPDSVWVTVLQGDGAVVESSDLTHV